MTKFRKQLIACSAAAGVVLAFAGCEDPASKARAEVQAELTAAAAAFQNTVLANTGALDEAGRGELRTVLNRLSSATSNEHAGNGQKASAWLLASDAHLLLADSQMSTVDETRQALHDQRLALHSMISAAERLNVIASALEAGNVETQLTALGQGRSAAEEALRQEQAHLAQVNAPLSQLESKIGAAHQQLTGLRTEENQLRREASELGHWRGFTKYEEAISVRKQADVIETSSSYDELERDYQYTPTREMHEKRIEQIESAIESIDLAAEELRENAASSNSLATKTRQDLDALTQRINEEVSKLVRRMDDELKPAVNSAAQDLASAASKAQQAGNSSLSSGNSARLTAAAASNTLGQLQAAWAFEQEQYASILQRLDASSMPGASGKYRSNIEQAEQAKAQAIEAAVTAFKDSVSSYERISGGNSAAVLALRHEAEVRIAALTGQAAPEAPVMETPQPDTSSMGAASTPASTGQRGADSPEALAAALGAMNTPRGLLNLGLYQVPAEHANYPAGAVGQFAAAVSDSLNASLDLLNAIEAQFGAAAADQVLAPMMAGMQAGMGGQGVRSARVSSTTSDAAQIAVTTSNGQSNTIHAKRIDGRWYMDFLGEMQGGMNQQGMDQMVQAMLPMIQASTNTTRSIAQRVRAGEFATPAEVTAAIQKAEQEAMGSMPQGFPGMPQR